MPRGRLYLFSQELRDEKVEAVPLQAADLLAWYQRRRVPIRQNTPLPRYLDRTTPARCCQQGDRQSLCRGIG